MAMRVRLTLWVWPLLVAWLAGCSHEVDIRPSELPKLNDRTFAAPAVGAPLPPSVGVVVADPAGKPIHIEGFAAVLVREFGQAPVRHLRPLAAQIHDGDLLDITSSGENPHTYALPNIERLSLQVYDPGKSTLVATLVTVVVTLGGTLLLVASL